MSLGGTDVRPGASVAPWSAPAGVAAPYAGRCHSLLFSNHPLFAGARKDKKVWMVPHSAFSLVEKMILDYTEESKPTGVRSRNRKHNNATKPFAGSSGGALSTDYSTHYKRDITQEDLVWISNDDCEIVERLVDGALEFPLRSMFGASSGVHLCCLLMALFRLLMALFCLLMALSRLLMALARLFLALTALHFPLRLLSVTDDTGASSGLLPDHGSELKGLLEGGFATLSAELAAVNRNIKSEVGSIKEELGSMKATAPEPTGPTYVQEKLGVKFIAPYDGENVTPGSSRKSDKDLQKILGVLLHMAGFTLDPSSIEVPCWHDHLKDAVRIQTDYPFLIMIEFKDPVVAASVLAQKEKLAPSGANSAIKRLLVENQRHLKSPHGPVPTHVEIGRWENKGRDRQRKRKADEGQDDGGAQASGFSSLLTGN